MGPRLVCAGEGEGEGGEEGEGEKGGAERLHGPGNGSACAAGRGLRLSAPHTSSVNTLLFHLPSSPTLPRSTPSPLGPHTPSAQVNTLLLELCRIQAAKPGAKSLVFSSWGRLLRLVGESLEVGAGAAKSLVVFSSWGRLLRLVGGITRGEYWQWLRGQWWWWWGGPPGECWRGHGGHQRSRGAVMQVGGDMRLETERGGHA